MPAAYPPAPAEVPPVLNPRQLVRIEAVHRGFLYQHLYAVALLLAVKGSDIASLAIERDDDLELRRDGATHYLQIKSRLSPLQPNDVSAALQQFAELRAAHASGARPSAARFAIVSNAAPSPGLLEQVQSPEWPADVELVTPQHPSAHGLPLPAPTPAGMLAACEAAAHAIPFGALVPATLVLKLAAIVQLHAAGANQHVITAEALTPLLEQIVAQLQDFPEPPRPYYPQRDEPPILSDQRVRLIVGFSGAGKTAWASEAARQRGEPIAYFNVGGLPSASIAANLARELVARFLGSATHAPRLPPAVGIDLLRAGDALLAEHGTRPLVVLDNAHEMGADDLRRIVEAAPHVAILALAQPWGERAFVEAQLQIEAERLEGYDEDTVAAVFAGEGVGIELEDARAILSLTGGLPLYVANAAQLTAGQYDGAVGAFVGAICAQANVVETAQELILERSFAALSVSAQDAAALLGLCEVPISDAEAMALLEDLGGTAQRAAAIRELRRASMLLSTPQGISLHDALRPLAGTRGLALDADSVTAALARLHLMLMASLHKQSNIPRLTFIVRLLPRIGQTDALVDLATSEMFYEQGNHAVVYDTLVAASEDATASPRDQFWAMDAVAYWQSRDGGTPERALVDRMAALIEAHPAFERRERLNLLFKQLVVAGTDRDRRAIDRMSAVGRRLTHGDAEASRLFRYNRAVALYRVGAFGAVRSTIEPLIDEMFAVMGFPEQQLIGANGPALVGLLRQVEDRDDIKRTADMLSLWASTLARSGHAPGLRRIQASKMYAAVAAGRSAAAAAMDAADEFLEFMADPRGARETIEQHVLPLIAHYGLTDMELRARAQYAVALAYCDDFEGARREIAILCNFGGDAERVRELAGQAQLIKAIRLGLAPLERRLPSHRGVALVLQPNRIGWALRPDDPCHCGSGRKHKRCHGMRRS